MKTLGFASVACVLLCLSACTGKSSKEGGRDKGKEGAAIDPGKLVGTWAQLANPDLPIGSATEFTRGGTYRTKGTGAATDLISEGTYKVEGDKIKFMTQGKPEGKTARIKVLTDDKLVLEALGDDGGERVMEYRRVK